MKKTHYCKLILDGVLLLLLPLLYHKRLISTQFHELAGLTVCGLILIHMVLNRRWIVGVGKRFARRLPFKTRLGYIVDAFLFADFGLIAFSGIMISEVLFSNLSNRGDLWKGIHAFTAALSLVFIGIHLGLHWTLIRGIFHRLHLPRFIVRPAAAIFLAGTLIYGGYSLVTGSFSDWIAAPFHTAAGQKRNGAAEHIVLPTDGNAFYSDQQNTPLHEQGQGKQNRGKNAGAGGIPDVFAAIASNGSVIALFAFLTASAEAFILRRRCRS